MATSVIDQLLDQDRFADTGTAEQTDLLPFAGQIVQTPDAGLQDLCGGLPLIAGGSGAVMASRAWVAGLLSTGLTQQVDAWSWPRHWSHLDDSVSTASVPRTSHRSRLWCQQHCRAGELSDLHHQLPAVVVDLNGVGRSGSLPSLN